MLSPQDPADTDTGGRPQAVSGGAADVAAVLLLVQASLAVLSSLSVVVLGLFGFPVPLTAIGLVGLLAMVHPVLLIVLAYGVARRWRWAQRVTWWFAGLTIVGLLLNLALNVFPQVQSESGLLVLMTNLVLPAAIIVLLKADASPRLQSPASGVAAWLILVSAAAHLVQASGHADELRELGPLMVLDALALGVIGTALHLVPRWPGSRLLRGGRRCAAPQLTANLLVYLVYVGSGREHVEQAALAVKLVELVALGLLIMPVTRTHPPRLAWMTFSARFVALGILTGGVAWVATLGHHDIPAYGESAHQIEPVPGGATRAKLVAPLTQEQTAAAARLVEETRVGAARYADLAVALQAGYTGKVTGRTSHLENEHFKRDSGLDPTRPAQLVYAATPAGPILLGVVYVMPAPRQIGPEVGGALTQWHTHSLCLTVAPPFVAGLVTPFGTCSLGAISFVTPEMLHVWVAENPKGPFADDFGADALAALVRTRAQKAST